MNADAAPRQPIMRWEWEGGALPPEHEPAEEAAVERSRSERERDARRILATASQRRPLGRRGP